MTQKSVSIRANVSIRGVTIRAYALYFSFIFYISKIYVSKITIKLAEKIGSAH